MTGIARQITFGSGTLQVEIDGPLMNLRRAPPSSWCSCPSTALGAVVLTNADSGGWLTGLFTRRQSYHGRCPARVSSDEPFDVTDVWKQAGSRRDGATLVGL